MARTVVWLDRRIVDALHANLIRDFGGSGGTRDPGLIESALARPLRKWEYEGADLPSLAAAYAYGLAKNHGYVDGNKRIAATAAGVFLELNGLQLQAPEPELVEAILAIAERRWSETELAAWIRDRAVPRAEE